MMGTFWTWMILVAVWWVGVTVFCVNALSNPPDWLTTTLTILGAGWFIVLLVFGSVEFLRYNQAFPFQPR